MRTAAALHILLAVASSVQVAPTHCQTSFVSVPYDSNGARIVVACDDSFPDDTLWNLDRSDQIGGNLDGRFHRFIDGTGSIIYLVDSGVLAAHDEFMTPTGSKIIAGIDAVFESGARFFSCKGITNQALEP